METSEQKIAQVLRELDEDKIDLIENPILKIESVQYRLIKHYICSLRPETTVLDECETSNDLKKDGFDIKTSYLSHNGETYTGKAFEVTRTVDILDFETVQKAAPS